MVSHLVFQPTLYLLQTLISFLLFVSSLTIVLGSCPATHINTVDISIRAHNKKKLIFIRTAAIIIFGNSFIALTHCSLEKKVINIK